MHNKLVRDERLPLALLRRGDDEDARGIAAPVLGDARPVVCARPSTKRRWRCTTRAWRSMMRSRAGNPERWASRWRRGEAWGDLQAHELATALRNRAGA